MNNDRFIACGMYAFNDDLRDAWQTLFDRACQLFEGDFSNCRLKFETDRSVLLDPNLCFGHTCGYPLMTHLRQYLTPFCVPLFDVPGCDGKLYSSVLITSASSSIARLRDCRDHAVAINTMDSNSGMNLLRHTLAGLGVENGFFRQVLLSGGHLQSLTAVAKGAAQLAAIDCVSYQLIKDQSPELIAATRILGISAQTCGLPFVVSQKNASAVSSARWIDALDQALRELPEVARVLHLTGFTAVTLDDYHSILDLEKEAIDAGYPVIN